MRAVTRDTFAGTLGKRLEAIEGRLTRLFTMAATSPQREVSSGDFIISGGGDLKIVDDDGTVVWSALDGPLKAASAQVDLNTATFAAGVWDIYVTTTVPVPMGYTQAFVNLFASAGMTLDGVGNGNVGVEPFVNGTIAGPGISNGATGGGPVSVSSFMATPLTGLSGGTILLEAYCQRSGDPVVAGSCNAHLSASIVFLR